MDSNNFNFLDNSNNFMPPASDSDKESTEPNHITDTDWMSAREYENRQFPFAASDGLFDSQPLAFCDDTIAWGNPVIDNAFDASSQGPSLAAVAGTGGVNTIDSSASPSEHGVNRYLPAGQDYTGRQTSYDYSQQLSPSSDTPSMTDDTTRASSNDPSTPGANGPAALDATHQFNNPFVTPVAAAVADAAARVPPTTSLESLGHNTNGVLDGMPVHPAGLGRQEARHTQPFPNPWQDGLATLPASTSAGPALWQPHHDSSAATMPLLPWSAQDSLDAVLLSFTRPAVAPQGGAHRNNTRSQRRNEPYSNQAVASGADLGHNNLISTATAPTGGARSNGVGRTTPSHPRTTKRAIPTATNSSTTAQGHRWMCMVEGCKGETVKSRGPNNEPILSSKQRFDSHMRKHARDSKPVGGSKPVGDSKPVICPICRYKFKSERDDSLGRHLKSETACKGKKDAEENDAAAPDDLPSDLHKHDDGDDDDDQGFGGMGGMSTRMPQALGQAGLSTW